MSLKFMKEYFDLRLCPHESRIDAFAASRAQEIFDKWLSEQPVVYGLGILENPSSAWYPNKGTMETHKARIVCIEEIKKCEHPQEKIYFVSGNPLHNHYKCECGMRLKVSSWEPVED